MAPTTDSAQAPPALGGKWTYSPPTTWVRARRLLWSMVQGTLFRFSFHTMDGWRSFLLRLFGAKVGRKCLIRRTVRVYYPWLLTLDDGCCLGDRAEVYNLGHITIESNTTVSQEAYLCAGSHDYNRRDMPLITAPIVLKTDSWVCARAFVSPGVTVGEGAIVGACAVVTRDVEPWTIVAGNPAQFVKKRERPV